MEEALTLFESDVNSRYFERAMFILFLSNVDVFHDKISSGMSPVNKYFPEYEGRPDDVIASKDFFAHKFRSLVRAPNKEVYVHYTNVTDTDLLKKTMSSVQDAIIQRNLNSILL
jgi:guanine nucleotide-binding protein subunit alpha